MECRLGLARAFNKMGAYKEVLKQADTVLGSSARFSLGVTLLRLSRDKEGVAMLKEYLERDPNPESAEVAKALIANPLRARKRLVPEFEAATLAGDYLTSEDVKGKVLLLDFWGTWCAPCVAAVPSLRAMSRRMEKDPFVLLSVSTDTDKATLTEFIAKHQMSWPQVWDERHELARKFRVEGYPTYMLVNHEGEIVYVVRGWGEGIDLDLRAKVSSAIRAARKSAKQGG